MNRPRTAAAAFALVAIAACSSRADLGPTVGSTTRQNITFSESGMASRDLEIAIAVNGSGPEHHIGLDGVTLPGWNIDAIEFVASEWPIVVEAEEDLQVVRTIHVRASANYANKAAHDIVPATVELVGDDGPIQIVSGFAVDEQVFDACANLAVDAIANQIGLTVLDHATTAPGAILQPIDIAASADGAWVLGLSPAQNVLRLVRMRDGGALLPKELPGFAGALAGGANGSVVVALAPDFETQLIRYDGDASKSWSHRITGQNDTALPQIAVAGGHVLADVPGSFVSVDNVTLPSSSAGATRILFDEVTGELLSSADTTVSIAMVGLSDGAFAVVADGQVIVVEADLTPRWSVDLSLFSLPIRLAEQGNKLWVVAPDAAVPLDLATGADAGPQLSTSANGVVAPLPDGSLLLGLAFGSLARVAPDGSITVVNLDAPAPWCSPSATGFASSFPGGAAFAISLAHTDPTLPGFSAPLPTLIGIATP